MQNIQEDLLNLERVMHPLVDVSPVNEANVYVEWCTNKQLEVYTSFSSARICALSAQPPATGIHRTTPPHRKATMRIH